MKREHVELIEKLQAAINDCCAIDPMTAPKDVREGMCDLVEYAVQIRGELQNVLFCITGKKYATPKPALDILEALAQTEEDKPDWSLPHQYWEKQAMPADAQEISAQKTQQYPDNPFWADVKEVRDHIAAGYFKDRAASKEQSE